VKRHAVQASARCPVLFRTLRAAPDLSALHQAFPDRYPCLLESVAHGTPRARFDILFASPRTVLELRADRRLLLDGRDLPGNDFLGTFESLWRAESIPAEPSPPPVPFHGGWFVFLAYELAAQIEPRLGRPAADTDIPLAVATRFPAAIVHDHSTSETYAVCESGEAALLDALERDAASVPEAVDRPFSVVQADEDDPERFLSGVRSAKSYIEAGDVFQVNLSRGWQAVVEGAVAPAELYRRLRAANPAPFAGLATWPATPSTRRAVISSSPERLVEVRDGRVRTRPIAGTYPRSADALEDRRWSQELLSHPKERAEHVMLIDLERNDLGRVCRPGSVRVSEMMALESYRHVHHIVSEISGELRSDAGPAEVLRAVFPGGTITGCPKVRCMEIIAELEQAPRGAYTGSMGYVNRDGSMDFNILIRTLVQSGNTVRWRAGAGIVADSVPERELAETRAKAKGLLAALGIR
jgi:anthranilate synthase component I